ncbi:MAG: M23 family metallopeptidase [Lunatimonas sp.]|uniref:M23 family metallopeptidase n=1 Tax=Lunatimonas sp. TaxID=2060141 RepID=UPI00263B2305|nr:M23 family metallopeptidase [Lunatimonas sp.]MCC5938215.1 M23 family metallopeptidase [Lunatimonas sp.]
MSKLSNQSLWALLLGLLTQVSVYAQVQQGYFTFPIKPGERNFLAGTMGEIRPNHFHSGIDIKTEGRQGLPVYAAADGYVYRMKISSFGYGNVLYVKHPSGNTTVYAHLREFAPNIANYMREKMYTERKNELELFPEAQEVRVKKGEVIAYSGNTGSSMGPHLHFEIRDSLDRALDPLHFGFEEIIDQIPPFVQRVAVSPLDMDSRVNGQFQRREFPVAFVGDSYQVLSPISVSGKVGLEVLAYDQLDDMYNRNGFPTYEIHEKGTKLFESTVNSIDFSLGRYILSHTYRNRFTRLYKRPENLFDFYRPDSVWSGALRLHPEQERELEVRLVDTYRNTRRLLLTLQGEQASEQLRAFNSTSGNQAVDFDGHVMLLHGPVSGVGDFATFFVNGYQMEMPYSYKGSNKQTYLWDMRLGLPDSVQLCTETLFPSVNARIPLGKEVRYQDRFAEILFEENSLLDDLYLRVQPFRENGTPGIRINDPTEYLREPIEVTFDAGTFEGDRANSHVYLRYENGYRSFQGGAWDGDRIRFKTRSLGTFVIATDSIAPSLQPIRINASEIRFTIRDNLSGIRDFEAYVDGEWVLMRYEHKQSMIWSEKISNKPFKGEVVVKVRDMANNEAIYRGKI